MDAEQVVFYLLATLTVAGAACVVLPPFGRNPLHAAVALLVTFFFLSGLFVLLSAHLVAVLQVLVYAGAVMVLFTFVVMLLSLRPSDLTGPRPTAWKVLGALAGIALVAKLAVTVASALEDAYVADISNPALAGFGGVRDVGGNLLMTYLFPFELTAVLLLVAVVGALVVARRAGAHPDTPDVRRPTSDASPGGAA